MIFIHVRTFLSIFLVVLYNDVSKRDVFYVSAHEDWFLRYETSVMKFLPPDSTSLKHRRPIGQKSFHFIANNADFIVDLQRYYPIGNIEVISRKGSGKSNSSFIDDADPLYKGHLRRDQISTYALGRFTTTGHFTGYFRAEDTYFIEPAGLSHKKELLIKVYRFGDALFPGCENMLFFVDCQHGFNLNPHGTENGETRKLRFVPKKDAGTEKKHLHLTDFSLAQRERTHKNHSSHLTRSRTLTSRAMTKPYSPPSTRSRNLTSRTMTKPYSSSTVNYSEISRTHFHREATEFSNISTVRHDLTTGVSNLSTKHQYETSTENLWKEKWNTTFLSGVTSAQEGSANSTRENLTVAGAESLNSISCPLTVVADFTFLKKHSLRKGSALADIFLTFAFVDEYLRRVDFDGDGKINNIGIVLNKIFFFEDEKSSPFSIPKEEDETVERYLKDIAKWKLNDESLFSCLIITMADKNVLGGSLGYSENCRLCQRHSNFAFLITSRGHGTIPMASNYFSAVVQVSSAFGVQIGQLEGKNCSAKSRFRNYNYGHYPDMLFTECRVSEVKSVLSKADCFVGYKKVTCGDGIKQRGETCDCGPSELCDTIDPCCTMDCVLKPHSNCTHEDPCCGRNCVPVKASAKKPCGGTCNPSTCNGKDAECPSPPRHYEGKSCLEALDTLDAMICRAGHCNLPLCSENLNLIPCRCKPGSQFECHKCCIALETGECGSVNNYFEDSNKASPYVRAVNTSCYKRGRCSSTGVCEAYSLARINKASHLLEMSVFCIILFLTM